MGKLRRNLENTHGFSQASYHEILQLKAANSRIESELKELSSQVHKATFKTVMTECDISEFFPVQTKEQLLQFMDREHPDWNLRKTEFYHFLYTIVSDNKRGFARGLIKAIFTREYINTVKWPSTG